MDKTRKESDIYYIKRMFCILTVLTAAIFILGNSVHAASDFKTKKNSGDIVLTEYTGKDAIVKIPKGVTIINRAFVNNKKVKKIILSDSVKEIYEGAFTNCLKLKEVKFSKNLKVIEKGAFIKCPKIKRIKIPKKCSTIGEWAFTGCTNLKKIVVEKENKHYRMYKGALYNKKKTRLIIYPRNNKKRTTFSIPKSVNVINGGAFVDNKYIKKLVFQGSSMEGDIPAFTGMKKLAIVTFKKPYRQPINFQKCKKLKRVILAEGTEKIGANQFKGCRNLIKINFPVSIKTIGYNAFYGCKKLVVPKFDKDIIIEKEYLY
ncbi:MAG: leucine-rich repeat protein [Eubacterium sp.]|nr:leucine-rich repeat protein [Eubacterium sp.]